MKILSFELHSFRLSRSNRAQVVLASKLKEKIRNLNLNSFVLGNKVLCSINWSHTPYVIEDTLDLLILLPSRPRDWNNRRIMPHLDE